jgi:hypothetical protein
MTLITGIGSAMYWATVNALVQEVIPPSQFTGANAAVLVGVQSGMLIAGAFVGFLYNTAGIAGILAIDGATYFVSAYCLYRVRRGYVSPRESQKYPREYSEATEATAEALETGENPEVAEAGLSLAVYADMKEGFAYLKQQPLVLALGITHAIMMAGVVSANVVLVALANDILHAGPRGLGFLEAGWATGPLCCRVRRARGGPHGDSVRRVSRGRHDDANFVWILPRAWRSRRAVFVDDHRAKTFHGANAIRDGDSDDGGPALHEFFAGMGGAGRRLGRGVRAAGRALHRSHRLRHPRPPAFAIAFAVSLIGGSLVGIWGLTIGR